MKSRVFIGSSDEGLAVAHAIQKNLDIAAEVTVWRQGIFQLSHSNLGSLISALDKTDFGIFVLTPDDISIIRDTGHKVARDNVIFELGLFFGRLGRDRTFFVVPQDGCNLHIPSDLTGITPAMFNSPCKDGDMKAALRSACTTIANRIKEIGSTRTVLISKDEISDAWRPLLAGATRSVRILSGDASWVDRDEKVISKLVSQGIDVRVICDNDLNHQKIKENIQKLFDAGAAVRHYKTTTKIRAIIIDWQRNGTGFALLIQKTAKTAGQCCNGYPSDPELYNHQAVRYFPQENALHVEALGDLFDSRFEVAVDAITLTPINFSKDQIVGAVQESGISHYSIITEPDIEVKSLTLPDLWSTCRYVKQSRLTRVKCLVDAYYQHCLRPFETVYSVAGDGKKVILPPIVEKFEDKYVVIDGMHRLFYHLVMHNEHYAECIVLTNDTPLPSQPLTLSDVAIVHSKRPRKDNFQNYKQLHYRKIKQLDNVLRSGQITRRYTRPEEARRR
jgi:hypothetical protein